MTKTSTRGGLLTRALSCGCAVALAASLAPAAGVAWAAVTAGDPLPKIENPTNITLNAGTIVNGKYTPFATQTVDIAPMATSSGSANATMYYDTTAKAWTVVATKNFVPLTDILKAAGMEGYWDEDASLNYSSSTTVTSLTKDNFKSYASYQDRYFYPETNATTATNASDWKYSKTQVPTGIALNTYAAPVNTAVNVAASDADTATTAAGTRDLMYKALSYGVIPTQYQEPTPTFMSGLPEGAYLSRWSAAAAEVVDETAKTASINILVGGPQYVSRIYGQDWADTMVQALNSTTFKDAGKKNVVLTTSETFQDALAASGLAGALGCPIVMTDGDELTPQVAKYLQSYLGDTIKSGPGCLYVIGGKVAIKDSVVDAIKRLPAFYGRQAANITGQGLTINRIAGDEAWDTALAIRHALVTAGSAATDTIQSGDIKTSTGNDDIVIACSGGYQDAMSIAPYAYATGTPIILTDNANVLSTSVMNALTKATINSVANADQLATTAIVNIIGGPAVVSNQVNGQILNTTVAGIYRTYGQSAYDTSNQVATILTEQSSTAFAKAAASFKDATVACFATGENYLDALASAAYCGTAPAGGTGKTAPLLLVSNSDETTVDGFLANYAKVNGGSIVTAKIFGGTGVLGEKVATDINQVLKSN